MSIDGALVNAERSKYSMQIGKRGEGRGEEERERDTLTRAVNLL